MIVLTTVIIMVVSVISVYLVVVMIVVTTAIIMAVSMISVRLVAVMIVVVLVACGVTGRVVHEIKRVLEWRS